MHNCVKFLKTKKIGVKSTVLIQCKCIYFLKTNCNPAYNYCINVNNSIKTCKGC